VTRLTPAEFLAKFCTEFDCKDHHHTGPRNAQQPEGHGSVTHEEGRCLAGLAAKLGGPALEIGGDLGISTRYIDEGLARSVTRRHGLFPELGRVYSIDPMHKWDPRDFPGIVHIHACSIDARLDLPYEWAFIDGLHDYASVVRDTSVAIDAGANHLIFHDTTPAHSKQVSEARAAVQDYLGPLRDWRLWDVQTRCGLVYACGVPD
jgi:methyltransferase family protein